MSVTNLNFKDIMLALLKYIPDMLVEEPNELKEKITSK